jgi:flagellar biosynthesis protein FliP
MAARSVIIAGSILLLTNAAPVLAAGSQSRALGSALAGISFENQSLSMSLQLLLLMSVLAVLPTILLMMTCFTRILIVLSILRQALGLTQTPPNQVLVGLALFLSLFVMKPSIDQIGVEAYQPYQSGEITMETAIVRTGEVLHAFMLKQTREADLKLFAEMAGGETYASPEDVPFTTLLPAFVTSELKTAFMIGFLIFLPFLVIDLVVSATLMALGMMMLSPTLISMPFKLLLFVLVDGWALTMGTLANSFVT